MKLCMKFFGSLAFGSSSARKYFSTCVSCFQKFNVSCFGCQWISFHHAHSFLPLLRCTHLKLLMAIEQQHVHRLELIHVSVSLELLPYLGANGGDGHVEGVHLLDLGALRAGIISSTALPPHLLSPLPGSPPYRSQPFPVALDHPRFGIVPACCYASVSYLPRRAFGGLGESYRSASAGRGRSH